MSMMNTIPIILQLLWSTGALGCAIGSVFYFRSVRLQRPPIGVFDKSDLLTLLVSIVVMPLIYLVMPPLVLTAVLVLIFMNILQLGLRPLLSAPLTWLSIVLLLGGNILATLAANAGWQPGVYIHWFTNDITILLVAIIVANLYVQCGMRARYVAWLALFLAGYDAVFAWGIPVTPLLANHFAGMTLEPAFGLTIGSYQGFIGLGDLLLFTLTSTVMYKGFGLKGALVAIATVLCFGILLPPFILSIMARIIGRGGVALLPVQAIFGPVVFLLCYWFCGRFKERSVRQYRAAPRGRSSRDRGGDYAAA